MGFPMASTASSGEPNLFSAPTGQVERVAVTDVVRRRANEPFAHDRFLLRQRHLAWNERYDVRSADDVLLLHVQRPARVMATIIVACAAASGFLVVAACLVALDLSLGEDYVMAIIFSDMMAATSVAILIGRMLAGRRDVSLQAAADDRILVRVRQDRDFQPIIATFTIEDHDGKLLARLRKNYLGNLLRRTWTCRAPDGDILCTVVEDHVVLALVRRLLGPLLGILCRNYLFLGADGRVVGRFNRRFTLLDRYLLDMTPDLDETIDRRNAVALGVMLGVMLDTGERR